MYSNTNLKQSLILRSKLVSDQRTLLLHHHLPQHSSVDVWRDQGFDWSESRPPHHQGSIVAFNKRSDHHFGLSFIIYHLERYSVALHDEERDATVTAVPSIDQQSGDYHFPVFLARPMLAVPFMLAVPCYCQPVVWLSSLEFRCRFRM